MSRTTPLDPTEPPTPARGARAISTSVSAVEFQRVFVQSYASMKHARFDRADWRFSNSRYFLHRIPHLVSKRQCYALI